MNVKPRRKLRFPVISRLTLAWSTAAGLALIVAGAVLYPTLSGRGAGRISLAVDGIETMARAETPAAEPKREGGLRLAPPGLREEAAEESASSAGADTTDMLAYPEEFDPDASEPDINPEDIVITIAGGERRVTPVTAASLTPVRKTTPIADPDPALLHATPWGKIPKVATDGRRAMNVYRGAYAGAGGRPRIALIVGGLGLNKGLTERAIDELPPEISLAFAPYAEDLDFWTKKARAAGHEVLIELPMESYGGDPAALGKAGLLSSRKPEENLKRLDWLLSRFGGYFAATNYLGGKLSADADAMEPILAKLREAGVAYIDDTGAAAALTARTGAAIASITRIVPPAPDDAARGSVRRALKGLEMAAEQDGAALGKTYAFPATIDEIAAWAEDLDANAFSLAPASTALPSRYASR